MRYRHHVRGYAIEQRKRPGLQHWNELLLLDNGELAEVVGDATSQNDAVERAAAWLAGSRELTPRVAFQTFHIVP
jgi:hypothetical protein